MRLKRTLGYGVLCLSKIKATTIKKHLKIFAALSGGQNLKMLALDLDGTTLNDNRQILPENIKAIAQFKNEHPDRKICIITGRGFAQSIRFAKKVNADFLITAHGGAIYQKTGKKYELIKSFPFPEHISLTIYHKLMECAAENPNLVWHFDTDNKKKSFIINKGKEAIKNAKEAFYTGEPLGKGILQIKNFADLVNQNLSKNIIKICIEFGKDENGKQQCQQFAHYLRQNGFNFGFTQETKIEIAGSGVNKGAALMEVTQKLGISNDQVITIGNDRNDKEMVAENGFRGWLVGNGNRQVDAPRLKNTNNDPFIQEAIEKSKRYIFYSKIHETQKAIKDLRPSLKEFFNKTQVEKVNAKINPEHDVKTNNSVKTTIVHSNDTRAL